MNQQATLMNSIAQNIHDELVAGDINESMDYDQMVAIFEKYKPQVAGKTKNSEDCFTLFFVDNSVLRVEVTEDEEGDSLISMIVGIYKPDDKPYRESHSYIHGTPKTKQ